MTFRKIINKSYLIIILSIIFSFVFPGCGLYYDYGDAGDSGEVEDGSGMFVKEVIDGDTIVLSNGSRVRLIGINTPEYGMYFFEEAREVLEAIVLEREVSLEKDITDKDKYGRLLRYVYTGNLFVNLEMGKRGFANAYTYPTDVK